MIKNIIWDIDGTLFDTYPAIIYAISKSLNDMGFSIAFNEIDRYTRQSLNYCMETLSRYFKTDPEILRSRFREHYRSVPPENQVPFHGVREICAFIRNRGGTNVAVTHRGEKSTHRLLTAHNLAHLFSGVICVEQGFPRKPDPTMFEVALQQFGLERTTTLAIGDRELDIQAGRAAGLHTCLFGPAELSEPADYMIEDYNQLLALFMETEK